MPYLGRSSDFGVRNVFHFLASAGDTSVSGNDADGKALIFTDGRFVDVYLNGVRLKTGEDYNTATANTIAGISAMDANDEVNVVVFETFNVANTVPADAGGSFGGDVTTEGTFNALGDTAAGDKANMGFTTAEGLILTGQGTTNDVTIKNDADTAVVQIPTGTTNVTMAGTLDVTSDITGLTLNADGDTSAGDNAAIGYTAAEGLILTGQGSTDDITIKNDADTTVVNVATGGTDVEISAGNILFGTADKGVYLGVTSATASNLLDDYEEGTFTATCANSVTLDASKDLLVYTKVGRLVTVAGQIKVDNGQGGADLIINNLPFTAMNASEDSSYFVGAVRLYNYNIANTALFVSAMVTKNTTQLNFEQSLDDATSAALGGDNGGNIMFTVTYMAA